MQETKRIKWCNPELVSLVAPAAGMCSTGSGAYKYTHKGAGCISGTNANNCNPMGYAAFNNDHCQDGNWAGNPGLGTCSLGTNVQ